MVYSNCHFSSAFCLSLTFCYFFRIAWLQSSGKELFSWLSACTVLLYAVLIACVPFPFGVRGEMWHSTASVSDHCLFVYFVTIPFRKL